MNNIIKLNIADITPYEGNPRHNDEAVEKVANSIKEFGFKQPIVVDKNNVIIAGHTRYKASKLLGLNEIPVLIADDLTDEQVKAYRLADNKTAELAEWDWELLTEELKDLEQDMTKYGFDNLENILDFNDDFLEEFYDEKETNENKKEYLTWRDNKAEITEIDIEKLNDLYETWQEGYSETSFIEFINGNQV